MSFYVGGDDVMPLEFTKTTLHVFRAFTYNRQIRSVNTNTKEQKLQIIAKVMSSHGKLKGFQKCSLFLLRTAHPYKILVIENTCAITLSTIHAQILLPKNSSLIPRYRDWHIFFVYLHQVNTSDKWKQVYHKPKK